MLYLVIPQTVSVVLLFCSSSLILIRQVELGDGSTPRRDLQGFRRGQTNLQRSLWSSAGKIYKVARK